MAYTEGDMARVGVTFRNALNAVADPTTITVRIRQPDNVILAYVFTVDPNLIRESTGVYYRDIDLTMGGFWTFRWIGTGAVQASVQDTFCVDAAKV